MSELNINLRHFFALTEIAATGRISTAAERVFLSQSALTQALRRLEGAAGTTLFNRAGFGVVETDAGALLIRRAHRSLDLLASAERELRTKQSPKLDDASLRWQLTASQLRTLVAVVDTGGYSTAARRLKIAQPTVHRAAKTLESTTNIVLFKRTARGAMPSDSAHILARCAKLIFAEIRQGFEEVWEQLGRTDSRVAIGSLPLVRSGFLPAAVTQLLERYPDARVSILDGPYVEQLHALRHGQIDWLIGALRESAPTNDVAQHALFQQPLAVAVRPGHPLLEADVPSVESLANLDWIAPRALAPTRKFFDEFFDRNKLPTPTRIIECSSLVATRGLLQKSNRAALLSPIQIREDVAAGGLAILVDAIPQSSRAIGFTTRVDWEPTTVQAEFVRILGTLANEVSTASCTPYSSH